MNALLIDAYDSFVYIIKQYLLEAGVNVEVIRNNKIDLSRIGRNPPDFIVLGPGPGHPADAGYVDLIRRFEGRIPILGICLGHQAIGLAYGCKIKQAHNLMHGKTSAIQHDGKGCFHEIADSVLATRYHSLIVDDFPIPEYLTVSARSEDDGYIMGLRHREILVEGIQFHPESITTQSGPKMFTNFIDKM